MGALVMGTRDAKVETAGLGEGFVAGEAEVEAGCGFGVDVCDCPV